MPLKTELPPVMVLSDSTICPAPILDTLKHCIDSGAKWIAVREYINMCDDDVYALCENIMQYTHNNPITISVWHKPHIAHDLGIGLHTHQHILPTLYDNHPTNAPAAEFSNIPFTGLSLHNTDTIFQSPTTTDHCTYATFSPVFNSISKSGYQGIGTDSFIKFKENYLKNTPFPLYAMGGITDKTIHDLPPKTPVVICGSAMQNPAIIKKL